MPRLTKHFAIASALVAAALAFAPAAHASRVGFDVSIGGPGYAVTFGTPYVRHYYRPAPVYVAPPVVYAPPPAVVYAPPPVVYEPRVVYRAPYRYHHRHRHWPY
jgi:hypothetical protein